MRPYWQRCCGAARSPLPAAGHCSRSSRSSRRRLSRRQRVRPHRQQRAHRPSSRGPAHSAWRYPHPTQQPAWPPWGWSWVRPRSSPHPWPPQPRRGRCRGCRAGHSPCPSPASWRGGSPTHRRRGLPWRQAQRRRQRRQREPRQERQRVRRPQVRRRGRPRRPRRYRR